MSNPLLTVARLWIILLFAGVFPAVSWAYSVSMSAPSSISYGSLQTTATQRDVYVHGSQFSVTDTRGSSVGYYATLSISNLTSGSNTIGRANVALYVTGATVSTLSGSANPAVVVPTGAGTIGTQYVSLSSAVTLISRTNAGGGLYGEYGVSPSFRLTVPAYSPSGSYTATITVTLIENAGACDPNYTWNGSTCVANSQTATCGGWIPAHASANSSTTYSQTWNGSAWAPTVSWGRSASAGTCTYECDSGYSWNGSSCSIIAVAANASYDVLSMHMNSPVSTTVTSAWTDHGNNGKTIVVNGGAQISTVQSKFGGASGYFGASSYLSLASTWDLQLGTGDFTIDFWVNFSTLHGNNNANNILISDGAPALRVSLNNDTTLRVTLGGTMTNIPWSPSVGTWYNVAVTRESGTVRLFVNGTLIGSGTNTGDASPPTYLRVGNSAESIDGYLDDLRITKGIVRYTTNFTSPSTRFGDTMSEDAYYANTALLLHMDGTNASTAFMDSGSNGKTVTVVGDAKVSTAQSKFGGASAYFDGSGDYLSVPDSEDFNFANESFTIEAWIYPTSFTGYPTVAAQNQANVYTNSSFFLDLEATNGLGFYLYSGNTVTSVIANNVLSLNQWQHVAAVRSGNTASIYVNGTLVGSQTISTSLNNSTAPIVVGGHQANAFFFGWYIDDLRIARWVARYTTNFTPSTSAFGDSTTSDPYYANNVLSLHGNGANASTYFPDSASNGKATTANGNASISTAQSKFGGASAYFDGDGDYASIPDSDDFYFPGDFTIEMWIRPDGTQDDYDNIYSQYVSDSSRVIIDWGTSGRLRINIGGTDYFMAGAQTWTSGTWYHLALVRNGNILAIYKDGIAQSLDRTDITSVPNVAAPVTIGGQLTYARYFKGNIDDVRITKWVARYTANFTPSASAFGDSTASDPYYANTVLLLHADGAQTASYGTNFVDTANNGKTVVASGNLKISSSQSKFGGASAYFDGDGDYASLPDSADWDFGTENFTIEFWAYHDSSWTFDDYLQYGTNTVGSTTHIGWLVRRTPTDKFEALFSSNGTWYNFSTMSSEAISSNAWHHISIVRSNGTLRVFVDGTALTLSNTNFSTALTSQGDKLLVWAERDEANTIYNGMSGYMDDIRITKWVARYTANFTPGASAFGNTSATDPYFANTVLLLHADGAGNSTFFPNTANNGKLVTAAGNAQISTAQSKFGGASMAFDGTGDYLTLADDPSLEMGNGNFTIEAFVYPNSVTNGVIVSKWWQWAYYESYRLHLESGILKAYASSNGTSYDIANNVSIGAITANAWHHIALVRSGNSLVGYIDGVGTVIATTSSTLADTAALVGVGGSTSNTAGVGSYNGYIDDLRISKWVARYTTNFTPPAAALPDTFGADPYFAQTMLLLHGDGTNAGTYFPDSTNNGKTVTAYGDAKITNAQSKFGGTSLLLDGSWDYLGVPDGQDFDFGSGDFTIEAWVYVNTVAPASGNPIISQSTGGASSNSSFYFGAGGNAGIWLSDGTGWDYYIGDTGSVTQNAWNHIAATRQGDNLRLFINGNVTSSLSLPSGWSVWNSTRSVFVGRQESWSNFSGYIDDLRITKGVARYTANFTPPTSEFLDE